MRDNGFSEILVSVALIVLLALIANPFHFLMPNGLLMMLASGLLVVFAIYAAFVWRERERDEREGLHKMIAGRFAFLAGTSVLVLGIVAQSIRHALDPWLVGALAAMICAKAIGLLYVKLTH